MSVAATHCDRLPVEPACLAGLTKGMFRVVHVAARSFGCFPMVVYASDEDAVSRSLAEAHSWGWKDANEFLGLLGAGIPQQLRAHGGAFLDIGANLGLVSFLFAIAGSRTISIEPMPENRMALNATLCLNPRLRRKVQLLPPHALGSFDQVRSGHSCAMTSTHVGRSRPVVNYGNAHLTCGSRWSCAKFRNQSMFKTNRKASHVGQRVLCSDVQLSTLDDILREINVGLIDAMKLDVEGSECNILTGAEAFMRGTHSPTMVVAEALKHDAATCIEQKMVSYGYVLLSNWSKKNADMVFRKAL